ncbi:sensor histidine kinase [Halobellus clavatus]|jgi:signal transduction histidine kinase|uniref:histidine kinase n=1 Tax=Halobellus clavatus TaxID=660517 RepID=A0A1H3HV49_9EURY|nr:GAF domain-containing sensor histidine kinase [Halobellus clavatus]SDY18589.1 Signal transduction histidine kinase [Halobellus clavatus]
MDRFPERVVEPGPSSNGEAGHPGDSGHIQLYDIVLDTSTSLMSAEPDEFDTKLRWVLESVGTHIGADRGSVFQSMAEGHERVASWSTDGVDPVTRRRAELDSLEWLQERLEQFDNVPIGRLEDVPPRAALRTRFREDDISAAVFLPIVDNWSFGGFVVFDVLDSPREWSDTEVELLRTVADMIGHSLARVRRETKLEAQNERLETFASVISHDLRNPLNVVTGSLHIAQQNQNSEHLDRAVRAANRMDDLVDQVLKLARRGRDVSDPQRLDLDAVFRRAWETVETRATTFEPKPIGHTDGDPERLREAFENLFRNAIEHGGESVTVRVGPIDGGFYVEDDGPGIPESERETVFDRGYTTDGGTGLGLAIVQSIFEAHGWSIGVCEGSDGGARFEVTGVRLVE